MAFAAFEEIKNLGKALIRRTLPESIQNKILLSRIRNDLRTYAARTVTHTYGTHTLQARIADRVAEDWYDHDWPTLTELDLLSNSQLRPGARVFDIGAHQGIVAMMLGHTVGSKGQIIAIEANTHNARIAAQNFELNHLPQVIALHRAVSDRKCKITLNEDPNGQIDDTGKLGKIEVDGCSVDELSREFGMPQVLFLDVEGFELHCLRGAADTLATGPDCFIEVHVATGLEKFGGSVEQVLAFFPAERFKLLIGPPTDQKTFIPLDAKNPSAEARGLMGKRFHLLALARKDSTSR